MELPQRVALMAHVTVLTDRPATARLNGYQKPTDHGRTDGGWEAATDHGPFVSRTSKAPARQPLQIRTGWPDPPRPGKSETAPVTSPGYGMRFDTSTLSRGWRPRWASECPTSSRVSSERLRLTQTIRTFDVGWRSVRVRSPAGSSGLPFVDLDADRHERLAHGARNHEPAHAMLNIAIRRGDASPPFEPSKARAPAECAGGGCPPNPRAATLLASALDGLPAKGSFGPGADQFALDEGVGRLTVQGTEVYRPAPVEEGADIVERPNPFGAKSHDHPPMISSPHVSGASALPHPILISR